MPTHRRHAEGQTPHAIAWIVEHKGHCLRTFVAKYTETSAQLHNDNAHPAAVNRTGNYKTGIPYVRQNLIDYVLEHHAMLDRLKTVAD